MIAVDTYVLLRYLIQQLDSRNPNWQHKAAMKIIYGASGARKASYALHVRRSNKAWFEY